MKRISTKFRVDGRLVSVQESALDWAVRKISPSIGMKRWADRVRSEIAFDYMNRSGARRSATKTEPWAENWITEIGDSDSDSLDDLQEIRARSQYLVNNHGLAASACKAKTTYCVGTGLKLNARVDPEMAGISPEQANNLNKIIEKEWNLFCKHADIREKQHFNEMQSTLFSSKFTRGDAFIVRRFKRTAESPYNLRLQMIEADQCDNPDNLIDTQSMAGGIERDRFGSPTAYHFRVNHPGSDHEFSTETIRIPARDSFGVRNVIHYHRVSRIGETRGIPELDPVIEMLRQVDTLVRSELLASVVQSKFTAFIKTISGDQPLLPMKDNPQLSKESNDDYQLGSGAIVELARDEDVVFANPSRPNSQLDSFIDLMLRHIGPAIELPVEVLINHFMSSYTAARAAFEGLWKVVRMERFILENQVCNQVLEWLMWDAVAMERIPAPGFFNSPIIRQGYLSSEWVGPAKGTIDEVKDADAAEKWINLNVKPQSTIIQEVTGEDPDKVSRKIRAEKQLNRDLDGDKDEQ